MADKAGALTKWGGVLKSYLQRFVVEEAPSIGQLCPLGAAEQRGVGSRFATWQRQWLTSGNKKLRAEATYVNRTQSSRAAWIGTGR